MSKFIYIIVLKVYVQINVTITLTLMAPKLLLSAEVLFTLIGKYTLRVITLVNWQIYSLCYYINIFFSHKQMLHVLIFTVKHDLN